MGNGASSSQGGLPAYDQRDVGSSVAKEQHDWQPEQAVAPKPETLSLQETRKSYTRFGVLDAREMRLWSVLRLEPFGGICRSLLMGKLEISLVRWLEQNVAMRAVM